MKTLPMLVRDFITIVLALGLSVTLRLTEAWAALERRNEEILTAQRTEELQNLRSQLNPHSIFNTLNTIYALIDIDTEQAKDAVHRLSKLLRYMLYENPSEVEPEKEMDFVRSYVSLMEMRLGPGKVKLDIALEPSRAAKIPTLLFLPLIENAFKHSCGVSADDPISISIAIGSRSITCTISNPCSPSRAGNVTGIGLANLRRRTRLIYGENASLSILTQPDRFTSKLTINDKVLYD